MENLLQQSSQRLKLSVKKTMIDFSAEIPEQLVVYIVTRLMTKPCSTGNHNETVKKAALFFAIIDVIMME